jgi:small subunit ribosomal protein S17
MAEDTTNETTDLTPAAPEATTDVEETTDAVVDADAVADPTPAVESEDTPSVEESQAAEEPIAETEPPADDAAVVAEPEVPAEPQAQSQPKKKFKRLPRSERPKKTRVTRPAPTGERKPISREPKPEHERGRRQERRGVVVSDAMDKTIVVKVDTIRAHPRYKKVIRRSTKFHAHDEANTAKVGDLVRIVETRPLSKTKNWRLAEIVEAAK